MIASVLLAAAIASPLEVRIDAGWVGLGTPISEHFVVTDRAKVERIARAVAAPQVTSDVAIQALASRENAVAAHRALLEGQRECSPDARALVVKTLTKPVMVDALRKHYRGGHTDDFPGMTVTLRFANGKTVEASTQSQNALMLPWTTPAGETWSAELSRAVAAAMPQTSKLRGRLLDGGLTYRLGWTLSDSIRDRVLELESRCRYAPMIQQIEKALTIERVYHAWPDRLSVHARVPGAPPNLRIDAHLTAAKAGVVAEFLQRAPRLFERARRVARSHPKTPMEIWYVDGRSGDDDAVLIKIQGRPMEGWVVKPNGTVTRR